MKLFSQINKLNVTALKQLEKETSQHKRFVDTVEQVAKTGIDLLKSREQSDEKLANANEAIQMLEETLVQLREFKNSNFAKENKFLENKFNTFITYIRQVSLNDFNFNKTVDGKSLASLDFYFKHELKYFFSEIRKVLKENELASRYDDDNELFNEIMHIIFTEFLTNYISAKARSPIPPGYQSKVDRFTSLIQLSLVAEQYNRVTQAIKQWMFPFAIQILSECELSTIESFENISDELVDEIISSTLSENLIKIERRIETYLASVQQIDQAIVKVTYGEESGESFYSWSCKDEKEQINRLFNGQQVTLKADVKKSFKSAVKFNRIELRIMSRNKTEQHKLDTILEDYFNINLKHGGISYFKYKNSFYSAWNDRPFLRSYSFKKLASTNRENLLLPYVRNVVYEKMMNGQFLISPYTTWNVQLLPKNSKDMRNLKRFIEKDACLIELALIGEGSYVNEELVTKELNLDHYFRQIEL